MARLSEVGGGFGQLAPQSLDYNGLEPTGLPAYEGTGYPATGFGERRNKLVKFNAKRVGRITRDPVNKWSDVNTRATVSTLGDLGYMERDEYHGGDYRRPARAVLAHFAGLRSDGSGMDHEFYNNLRVVAGLGLSKADVKAAAKKAGNVALLVNPLTAIPMGVQAIINGGPTALVDMFVKGLVPQSFIDYVTNKIVSDSKALDEAYNLIQKYKALPPARQPKNLPDLIKAQQDVFSKVNNVKYYALLLTDFQKSLGFTSGKPRVTPPDISFIKRKAIEQPNQGFFASIGSKFASMKDWVEDKATRTATEDLIKKGYVRGTLNGVALGDVLGDGGFTAAAVSVVAVCALIAFLKWNGAQELKVAAANTAIEAGEIKKKAIKAKIEKGEIAPEEGAKQLEEVAKAQASAAEQGAAGGIGDIAKYAAYAVGGIVLIYALGLFKPRR